MSRLYATRGDYERKSFLRRRELGHTIAAAQKRGDGHTVSRWTACPKNRGETGERNPEKVKRTAFPADLGERHLSAGISARGKDRSPLRWCWPATRSAV